MAGLAVVIACTSSAAPTPTNVSAAVSGHDQTSADSHDDDAPRISLEDAKKAFDEGTAVFLDTRSEDAFNAEHVKGAINIPMSVLSTNYNEIAKGKTIIAYCS